MTKIKLFIFICFCALSTITQAQQAQYTLQLSDVTFSNGEITNYTNTTEKNIIIPDNFNDVAVETIGKDAFKDNELTNVVIPNSVNSIGNWVFADNQLTEVIIPNSVESIGEYAFRNNQLTEVIIPDFVKSIGNYAFYNNKLTEVSIGNSVESIGDYAFIGNQLTNVIIPNSVKSIGNYAFQNNKLTEVSIGNSVLTIGDGAFFNNKLTEVIIPNSVKSIGSSAFQDNKLTNVIIPNSVKSIGEFAFYFNKLAEVSIPNSVESIGNSAFSLNRLTEVIIGNSVNSIGEDAFRGNDLTNVSIPNSVESIGNYAFYKNKLTEVIIPNSVKSIGSDAFQDNQLIKVSIGNSVTSIGKNAFSDNTGLTSFNLPTHYQGYSYSWTNSKKSGDEITDFILSYELDEDSKGNAVDFTISYTLDGGTNDANNPADYTVETATITLAEASKDGYTFEGWYSEAAFTNQVTEIATGSTGPKEFFAKFSETYNITYTLDGGTNAANNPADYTVETATITLAEASKVGYTFEGWYSDAAFTNQVTEIATGSTGDISLYAKYSDEYTLQLSDVDFSDGEITAYTNTTEKNIIIPDNFNDVAVTFIGEDAFQNNQLTQVSIPSSVTSIGEGAFSDNTGLTSFNLPTHYQGSSYPWSNGKKSGDEITDFALSYELDEDSKGDAVGFTITYTLDGGTNAANNPANYTIETDPIILVDATKDGYTFEGWYSDAAFTADNEVTEIATGSTGHKEFFAKFSETYNITYTLDGGTNAANNPANYTIETETIILADATKDGYTFEGWYSDAAFTTDNEVTEIATGSTGPKEFFAKFSETYNITYNLDGGTNAANNPADYTVETATITLADASKDGYTFEGWYSEAAFTNQVTEIATGSTGPKEFFAKFSDAITYNITYNFDGGTNAANNPADYTVETATITLADASKDGYTFEGWYSEAAFTNQVTEIATGSTGPKEFFAKFSDAITYDITYTLDGGTNDANNPADYTVETATITLANASKDGYTFEGWYSEAAFTNQVTEIATGSTGNKEFFAKFSETYNITYTLDGGTNAANNPADYTVETATITLADASKDGYTFEGWYSEAAFTNQVTEIATGSTGDVVLFAKYSEIALGIYTTNIKVFNFYPNPSIDFIQTELEVSSLTIRSISGPKVKQFEGGSFFDISNLKSGVYILLAIDKNGDTYKSKLLKE